MTAIQLTCLFHLEDDEVKAFCPELEIMSVGATYDEAIRNLDEAIDLYVETAREVGSWGAISDRLISLGRPMVTQKLVVA